MECLMGSVTCLQEHVCKLLCHTLLMCHTLLAHSAALMVACTPWKHLNGNALTRAPGNAPSLPDGSRRLQGPEGALEADLLSLSLGSSHAAQSNSPHKTGLSNH